MELLQIPATGWAKLAKWVDPKSIPELTKASVGSGENETM